MSGCSAFIHRILGATGVFLVAYNAFADDEPLRERALERIGFIPEDNAVREGSAAGDLQALGEKLFRDPRLSGGNNVSCATCHNPAKAFTDGRPRAQGLDGNDLPRNTPTLLNTALHKTWAWEGRGDTLEEQSLEPIADPNEMNQELAALADELNSDDVYRTAFERAFKGPADSERIGKALGAYQRTLTTHDSPFDRYLRGDDNAISPIAKEGLELFLGEAECITCHSGPLMSDGEYYRLGVGEADKGRADVTGKDEDAYRFRVPTLRNVAHTAPYMHDGSFETLYEVVQFYFRHSGPTAQDDLPLDFEPLLGMSYSEIDALIAFLKTLSDDSLHENEEGNS
jgi:cytochrome c peroxidase